MASSYAQWGEGGSSNSSNTEAPLLCPFFPLLFVPLVIMGIIRLPPPAQKTSSTVGKEAVDSPDPLN